MEKHEMEIPTLQKNKDTNAQQPAQSSCCSTPANATACCTPSKSPEENNGACCTQPADGTACCDK